MVPIKIECDKYGQHYAFDVEPANGRMPSKVACPSCGMDSTNAANDFISRQLFPDEVIVPPTIQPVCEEEMEKPIQPVSRPTNSQSSSTRRPDPRLGLVSREQAEHEARAKVMWGDSRDQIVSYLMVQGFSHPEAMSLTDNLFRERTGEVRKNGAGKMIKGGILIGASVTLIVLFLSVGFVSSKLLGQQ